MPKILNVRGPIIKNEHKWIYDWFEYDATCPNDISKILDEAKGTNDSVILKINSPGGYVDAASEMYEEIRESNIHVEARITGNCYSAATYLACAANETTMSPLGQFMIHRCAVDGAGGNANDFRAYLESLTETDRGIANAYALKTGMNVEDILKMMDETTYMSAEKAKEKGFVDRILYTEDQTFLNNVNVKNIFKNVVINKENVVFNMIPDSVINEMMKDKELYNKGLFERDDSKQKIALARLNLLELGGKI